jgi:two-component system OmpR family sensor kinase
MSLRGRLLAGLVSLVMIGMLVSDVVTYTALRSFLVDRVDQQLEDTVRPAAQELELSIQSQFRHGRPSERTIIPAGTDARLLDGSGRVVATLAGFREPSDPPPHLPALTSNSSRDGQHPFTARAEGDSSLRYRVLATPTTDGGTFVVALPMSDVTKTLGRLVLIEVVVTLSVVVLLGLLSLWVVRVGLRPLDQMATTAGAIAEGDLSRRVERADDRTEVGRLGTALNAMLGHIERAFAARTASEQRLRRFVADASHELRTPLTAIRGYAELFRRGAAERPDDLATAMRRIEDESARMSLLVDDLLLLARLDQGRPLEQEAVDLVALASDAVDDALAVSPDRPITFETNGPVTVTGDEARLRQVTANLLANARVHTPEGTRVHVRVRSTQEGAQLEVADEGPGLAPDEAAHAFERFYRADPARARSGGGSGLGLSIVAAIAAAHGGRATLDTAAGRGATFRVELPRVALPDFELPDFEPPGVEPPGVQPPQVELPAPLSASAQQPPITITDQRDQNE